MVWYGMARMAWDGDKKVRKVICRGILIINHHMDLTQVDWNQVGTIGWAAGSPTRGL